MINKDTLSCISGGRYSIIIIFNLFYESDLITICLRINLSCFEKKIDSYDQQNIPPHT